MPMPHTGHRMIIKVIALLAITSIVIVSIIRDRIVNNVQWQVTVTGQGKVSYTPDIALVTLGVQIDKAPTAQIALQRLNDAMAKILPAVKKAGIDPADIQTQNYSLLPQYDYKDSVSTVSGYNANQQLIVKIKNIGTDNQLVSKVIDEASKAGANQVLGVTFDVSNINDLKQQARILAITDARSKAGALAEAAHVHLGAVVGWYENFLQGPGNPQPYYDGKGGAGGGAIAPQVPVGDQDLIIEMGVNYRIK